MVDQQAKLVTGDVVASTREQDSSWDDTPPQQSLDEASQLLELAAVGHRFETIAFVGNRLDIVAMIVFEHPQHVVPRIVKPGIAVFFSLIQKRSRATRSDGCLPLS